MTLPTGCIGRGSGESPALDMLLSAKPDALSGPSLDLANVTFVDRRAMLYLLCARKRNIALENCPSTYSLDRTERSHESGLTPPLQSRSSFPAKLGGVGAKRRGVVAKTSIQGS